MNLRDELPNWHYREVLVNLHIFECMTIYESIMQLMKEYREKKSDFFRESFTSQIRNEELSLAYEFFHNLREKNSDMKELTQLAKEEKKKNDKFNGDSFEFSFESQDPFGFELSRKMSDISIREVTINLELLPLVAALRVSEAYKRELNYRNNVEASMRESKDWSPPSNFEHGTDDEKEIWEDFQRSQNSRK